MAKYLLTIALCFGTLYLSEVETQGGNERGTKMQYVVTSGEAKALAALAKLASKDQTRPMLQCIRLEVEGGRLRAYVTDSYRLARYEVKGDANSSEDGAATVDAKALAVALKGAKLTRLETAESDGLRTLRVLAKGGATTELREVEGRYPDCERLLEHDKALPEVGNVNPAYLADVCSVVKSAFGTKASMRVETHASSAWHISASDLVRGAFLDAVLMPCRS